MIEGVGEVKSWVELADLGGPLVSFRWTYVFASDGEVLTSDSTLRFRERDEVEAALITQRIRRARGRDATDRPDESSCSSPGGRSEKGGSCHAGLRGSNRITHGREGAVVAGFAAPGLDTLSERDGGDDQGGNRVGP